MEIIRQMQERGDFTERERNIRDYLMEHPESILSMTAKQLGEVSYSSTAAVSRFCRKIGCQDYGEFRLRFLSELQNTEEMPENSAEHFVIQQQENVMTIMNKIADIDTLAVEKTKRLLTIDQMARVGKMVHEAKYIDFYAFDMNIHLARYGCSQFFHCDKVANTYTEDNIQKMMALQNNENHLSIMISHTGSNKKLVELAKDLHRAKAKTILITSQGKSRMKAYVDEVLLTPRTLTECGSIRMEGLWTAAFSAATKYLLDVMFAMEFSAGYDENIKMSRQYYEIGAKSLWYAEKENGKL